MHPLDLGADIGIDALLQIIAGHTQIVTCLQQQTFQRGDRALGGSRTGGDRHSALKQIFFAAEFHWYSSSGNF